METGEKASFAGHFAQNFLLGRNKVLTLNRTGVIVFNEVKRYEKQKTILTHEKIFRVAANVDEQ